MINDERSNQMEEKTEIKKSKINLFFKILAIPFILYMIFFLGASMVLIFGSYSGN
jgi:hypothetical protein